MAAVNKPNAYQTYYVMFHCCYCYFCWIISASLLISSNCDVMSEMAFSIITSSLITIGRTPFVAAFEGLLGTLRTGR
jgi:hypothetical protein